MTVDDERKFETATRVSWENVVIESVERLRPLIVHLFCSRDMCTGEG
jgi:hypothetical protein